MRRDDLKKACEKAQAELGMLYEIGNAMRTTLDLEQILYIILTAVTSHVGLSFNRAMLFLVNNKKNSLEGKMGIGPDTEEDADEIWSHIEKNKLGLDQLIESQSRPEHLKKSKLNKTVLSIKIPIKEDSGILALTAIKGTPFTIKEEKDGPEFLKSLNLEEFVTVPLKARDKVIGVILADNFVTKKPITEDDLRMLTMFANQAGLAIENSRLYEKTVVLSNSDSLTGLWHHGHFQYLLDKKIKESKKKKELFTILMIDIDNFKKFNDGHGHQTGDEILKTISRIFKQVSRKIDIVARYGGEEFVIILSGTNKEESLVLAERVRKAVESSKDLEGITISIGVASFPKDADNKQSLISKADAALYEAKRTGKNKVCT